MTPQASNRLSAGAALTIARIVRVNHAGEFGAIRIYAAQITVARRLYPDLVPALSEMLGHERIHCAAFFAAMPARNSRPCRMARALHAAARTLHLTSPWRRRT
jgi:ubiquinone biosynthesis monooxygenase Coq7